MRCSQIRRELCRESSRFSMPMLDLKARLGSPEAIHILSRWCSDTGRDVVRLTYRAEDGVVDVFCPIELIQGEEHAIDGWLTVAKEPSDPGPSGESGPPRMGRRRRGLPPTQPRLFG